MGNRIAGWLVLLPFKLAYLALVAVLFVPVYLIVGAVGFVFVVRRGESAREGLSIAAVWPWALGALVDLMGGDGFWYSVGRFLKP